MEKLLRRSDSSNLTHSRGGNPDYFALECPVRTSLLSLLFARPPGPRRAILCVLRARPVLVH